MNACALLYWKHFLIRTPFERAARWLRYACNAPHRIRHTELSEIHMEERRIRDVLRRVLRPDSNCIDVGAHIGSTLSDIVRLSPRGKHFAFEPIPYKAKWLRRKFPEAKVYEVALSDTSGRVTFYEDTVRPGFSGLGINTDEQRACRAISVRCEQADALIPVDQQIDFIKIDVEGAELLVLRGMASLSARSHPIIVFESGPEGGAKLAVTRRDLYQYLTIEMRYDIYFLRDFLHNGAPLSWSAFDEASHYPFRAFNFVACLAR